MQNSLERLFEGTATALVDDVLPALSDPYARGQVLAAAELLANLAVRVEWRSAGLREEVERIRPVLAAASTPPAVLSEPVPDDNEGLLAARERHLEALTALQASEPDAVREPLRELLAWQVERERSLLRTGSYA